MTRDSKDVSRAVSKNKCKWNNRFHNYVSTKKLAFRVFVASLYPDNEICVNFLLEQATKKSETAANNKNKKNSRKVRGIIFKIFFIALLIVLFIFLSPGFEFYAFEFQGN